MHGVNPTFGEEEENLATMAKLYYFEGIYAMSLHIGYYFGSVTSKHSYSLFILKIITIKVLKFIHVKII